MRIRAEAISDRNARLDFGHAHASPRNPHFMRGWPEFTRPRRRAPGNRLAVHAQGVFMVYLRVA